MSNIKFVRREEFCHRGIFTAEEICNQICAHMIDHFFLCESDGTALFSTVDISMALQEAIDATFLAQD